MDTSQVKLDRVETAKRLIADEDPSDPRFLLIQRRLNKGIFIANKCPDRFWQKVVNAAGPDSITLAHRDADKNLDWRVLVAEAWGFIEKCPESQWTPRLI